MRPWLYSIVFVACAAMSPIAAADPFANLAGVYGSPSERGGLVEVTIGGAPASATLSAKGDCTPSPCDWGQTAAIAYAPTPAVAPASDTVLVAGTFRTGFSETHLWAQPAGANRIRVTTATRFTDTSGRNPYTRTVTLTKQAAQAAGLREDCINVNWRQVSVQQIRGTWKLVQGSMWISDFGTNKAAADAALATVQGYRLTKQCFVGRPGPSLEYWLNERGDVPSGMRAGEDCVGILPNQLSVQNNPPNFTVVSGASHWAFAAPTSAEANDIIAVIQKYGATQSCFIARPNPPFRYLRK